MQSQILDHPSSVRHLPGAVVLTATQTVLVSQHWLLLVLVSPPITTA